MELYGNRISGSVFKEADMSTIKTLHRRSSSGSIQPCIFLFLYNSIHLYSLYLQVLNSILKIDDGKKADEIQFFHGSRNCKWYKK